MPERTATVASRVGLHARPAAIFAEAAGEFDLDITIARQGEPADEAMDAASILSLMSLGASHGDVVVLRAEGKAPTRPGAPRADPGNGSRRRIAPPSGPRAGTPGCNQKARPAPSSGAGRVFFLPGLPWLRRTWHHGFISELSKCLSPHGGAAVLESAGGTVRRFQN